MIRPVRLGWHQNWVAAAARVASARGAAWLDGDAATAAGGDWSCVAAEPIAVLRHWAGGPAELESGGRVVDRDASFWNLWRRTSARIAPGDSGGWSARWIGCLGFDLAGQLEHLPHPRPDDIGMPLAWLALYDSLIAIDLARERVEARFDPRPAAAFAIAPAERTACFESLVARWAAPAGPLPAAPRAIAHAEQPRTAHEDAVARAIAYIAAGDIYQVNLARRLRLDGLGDALAAYCAARASNSAAYRAFIRFDEGGVASFSPELMLDVRGRHVRTSPIKGTRPRDGGVAGDRARVAELLASPKDAAELAMIVDLHRNDLGRVCRPHSVRVAEARRVELHPSVIHTVGDVVGELRDDCDAIDALAASFPAGSISGVPKLRALEIIRELEPAPRGIYTGAIGWMDVRGDACWSVAIRIVQFGRRATVLHVGGGIVADSDLAAEYAETEHKARGILHGLGATGDRIAGCVMPTD